MTVSNTISQSMCDVFVFQSVVISELPAWPQQLIRCDVPNYTQMQMWVLMQNYFVMQTVSAYQTTHLPDAR